jgi:Spy/CpxP family protein refolding chaperone
LKRSGLALVVALCFAAAFAATADPAKPDAAPGPSNEKAAAAWQERLAEAQARITKARDGVANSERALTRARHRKYPRGEALDDLVAAAEQARTELAAAEAELPELVEQARAAGVEPGVLRRFEADD